MSRYKEIPNAVHFPQLEVEVLGRWKAERTFEKSLQQREGAPEFVFYDGPPFATGLPHYGHILTSFIKDVVPRYFTMRGCHVPRRWGWDCHGLPVEFEVEKSLGFSSRADILKYGIAPFNQACQALVMRYSVEWENAITRLGRWVDFHNAYKTMDPDFTESVVWCFKTLHDRGLIYEGQKVVAYCIRCQTALSNFEARLDDAYRPRDDLTLTVKFALAEDPSQSFLAWTTTPWTLPSNAALAVNPDLEYVRMQRDAESVWLAASAVGRFSRELQAFTVVDKRVGRDLAGLKYRPPFDDLAAGEARFRVLAADFVSAEEGTGVVHLAPAFGEEDQTACTAHGINGPNPIRDNGTFDDTVRDFTGLTVFAANEPIARALKLRGMLFRRDTYRHEYPHCWRCDEALIYRAIPSWFVQVTAFKEQMVANNDAISWVPDHVGHGRFEDWLKNARDWAVSRNRFWGAPVPVWRCAKCGATEVLGSGAEIERRSGRALVDWHRPHIDEITLPCHCGHAMHRVPEVLDCWFESGAMPYGQVHYPFENKQRFERTFPGNFIVEYIAQTRGWFYTMVALASALFDKAPFKNAVCHGVILGEDGRKMSKRLRNYPDPMELVEEHGSDPLRIALLSSGAVSGVDVRFSAASVRDSVRRFHLPIWNTLHLLTAYANIDKFEPTGRPPAPSKLDRYLLSEAELLRLQLEQAMSKYDFTSAYRALEDFVTMLSTWYIRLTKPVFWKPGLDDSKRSSFEALHLALVQFAKLSAPFMPFLSESLFSAVGEKDSVHLQDWPAPKPEWRDDKLLEEMRTLRRVVRIARRLREQNGIKHRHPLHLAQIAGMNATALAESRELLEAELNVKTVTHLADPSTVVQRKVVLDGAQLGRRLRGNAKVVAQAVQGGKFVQRADGSLEVAGFTIAPSEYAVRFAPLADRVGVGAEQELVVVLDLESDEALVREGIARDLNRTVQDLRKRARLEYDARIVLAITGEPRMYQELKEHREWLMTQCLATSIIPTPLEGAAATETVELGGCTVTVSLARQ